MDEHAHVLKRDEPDEHHVRLIVEALLYLGQRRQLPHDEDLPPEPVLWGRLAARLAADGVGPAELAEATARLSKEDLSGHLGQQIELFAQGLWHASGFAT